jgi:hypothetical protein
MTTSRVWLLTILILLLLAMGAGDAIRGRKPSEQIDLERIAASDPRIEYIARAICISHGLDPDHDQLPYPGPLWERFILEARDFLAEEDAQVLWEQRHPGRKGPPD